MKTAVAKQAGKKSDETFSIKKAGGESAKRDREGRIVLREVKSIGSRFATPEPVRYDAEDIEEANRIGAALCRQHAR